MARTQSRRQRQRIRQLEKALSEAKQATPQVWYPVPQRERALAKAKQGQMPAGVLDLVKPVYQSQIPRLDLYQIPDTFGAYQKGRLWSQYGGGVSFELLRLTVKRCMLIQAIHSCCLHELLQLTAYAKTPQDLGWRIEHLDAHDETRDTDTPEIQARCDRVRRIFQTPHPIHEATFPGFIARALRDHLTINRVVIELIRDRRNRVVQFRCVDGATILPTYRVIQRFIGLNDSVNPQRPDAYEVGAKLLEQETGMPIRDSEYVCVIRGELVGTFAPGELLVWEFDPSSDIRDIFPASYVEKALEGIISWLHAFHYNRNYFTVGNPIEVILGISGEIEDDSFVTLQETLRENFSGLKGAWRVPLVQLPTDQTMQVVKLKENHKDMEFMQWMNSLISLVCAIYRKDPSRIYCQGMTHQGTALFEHTRDKEIEASEEEGFQINRAFFGENLAALVRLIDTDLTFTWSGLDAEDRNAEMQLETQDVQHFRSVDEIRQLRGDKPYKQPWSEVPLNPLIFQAAGIGASGMPPGMEGPGGQGPPGESGEDDGYPGVPPAVLARLKQEQQQQGAPGQQAQGPPQQAQDDDEEDDDGEPMGKALAWEEVRL
jgi:hypothetical protein